MSTEDRGIFDGETGDWEQTMAIVVKTMREMSQETDPQAMVRAYGKRMRQLMPIDRALSLSRRDLARPWFRITRSSTWEKEINPWKEPARLPVLAGGLLGDLIYGDEPRLIDELRIDADDPAAEYLAAQRSVLAIPLYDHGIALNMVVLMREEPSAFSRDHFPEHVWMSNLFGQAAHNLVLSEELRKTYAIVERELRVTADIQRSLLPKQLPTFPALELAASYQTSRWAGGDYYDIFTLPDGRCGILIADVSGHGTPAAVVMAITHSIAHSHPGHPEPPGRLLDHVNQQLTARYTTDGETFVTAFYGIYDPVRRTLQYASAGHNPPRLMRCETGDITSLDHARRLPLGINADEVYEEHVQDLRPGDQILFYTDGVTEATDPVGRQYGLDRLDQVLTQCALNASDLIQSILDSLEEFTAGQPAADDRTLLMAKVS